MYSERLYLFGTDDPGSHKEWVNSIAKVGSAADHYVCDHIIHRSALFSPQSFLPAAAEPLLRLNFERIGRLKYKGLNLQTSKVGWFALVGSTLHAYLSDSPQGEEIQLRKLNELCEWRTPINADPIAYNLCYRNTCAMLFFFKSHCVTTGAPVDRSLRCQQHGTISLLRLLTANVVH